MKDTATGAAVYTPLFLKYLYDNLTHRLYCPYVWQCSAQKLRSFFNDNISNAMANAVSLSRKPSLLDIGVGTGYFLEHAPIADGTEIVLADLNPNCIEVTRARVAKSHPETQCEGFAADFLDTEQGLLARLPEGSKFDAISTMLLLHCVPGPPARKALALVSLRSLLQPQGTLFGATVLGRGVKHNTIGRLIMYWHNSVGVFENYDDDVQSFVGPLKDVFESVEWQLCGTMLLFQATGHKVGGTE